MYYLVFVCVFCCLIFLGFPFVASSFRIGLDCAVFYVSANTVGYMGDGFLRSKDPANSIKVLEMLQRKKQRTKTTKSHI